MQNFGITSSIRTKGNKDKVRKTKIKHIVIKNKMVKALTPKNTAHKC